MTGLGYTVVGAVLLALGIWGVVALGPPLRKLLALNIASSGVFLIFVAVAYRAGRAAIDPVPHALVLTGIVVSVSATALGVALMLRSRDEAAAAARERSSSEDGV